MERLIFVVAVALVVFGSLCSTATAAGPTIYDEDLHITLILPDGFEPVLDMPPSPDADIRHAYTRPDSDGNSAVLVLVQALRGTIGREQMGEKWRAFGADRVYSEKWKSFEVEVVVSKKDQDGSTVIVRSVQVPIAPRAIQVTVFGDESNDAELADLTKALLASLDGPSNWLTNQSRAKALGEAVGKLAFWIVVFGAVVYVLTVWRTGCFQAKAVAAGIPEELAKQRIRPSWAWYLPGAYVFMAGLLGGSMMVFIFRGREAIRYTLGVFCLGLFVASLLTGIVMWRRVRTKRRILATVSLPATSVPPPSRPPESGPGG